MKKTIASIIILGSVILHGGIVDNINKAIEVQGKALDKMSEVLDKNFLKPLPVIDFNKNCVFEKSQLNSFRVSIKNERKYHKRIIDTYKKSLNYSKKNIKKLTEENRKLKALLKIHRIDYKHADIKINKTKPAKKIDIQITNK